MLLVKNLLNHLRRAARYNFGLGFGYLFPIHGYDNDKKSFTINAYFDYEVPDYAVGLMIGARNGFAINLYGNYLFTKTDVCPYLGASLGFHWVAHNDFFFDDQEGDGIGLGLNWRYKTISYIHFPAIHTGRIYNDL
jgi:hypothetical protein